LFACGDSDSRPCTRLRQWITSQHLNDRAEMRDADMSVSTTRSVGDVRPRFISLHEGLHLTSSPPTDWPSSSEGTSGEHRPRCEPTGP